jgi:hypothetical protein
LNHPEVHPGLEQVGRKGVPEGVRVKVVKIRCPGHCRVEDSPHRAVGEPAATLVDEQSFVGGLSTVPPRGPRGKIALQGVPRLPSERDQALLATLATHAQQPLVELDVCEIEGHEFADAKPRRVQQFEDGTISRPRRCRRAALEELFDGGTIDNLGHSARGSHVSQAIRRVRIQEALGHQVGQIGANARKRTCDGSGRQPSTVQMGQVGPQSSRVHLGRRVQAQFDDQEVDDSGHLATVGDQGGCREVSLPLEMFEEALPVPLPVVVDDGSGLVAVHRPLSSEPARAGSRPVRFRNRSTTAARIIWLECRMARTPVHGPLPSDGTMRRFRQSAVRWRVLSQRRRENLE